MSVSRIVSVTIISLSMSALAAALVGAATFGPGIVLLSWAPLDSWPQLRVELARLLRPANLSPIYLTLLIFAGLLLARGIHDRRAALAATTHVFREPQVIRTGRRPRLHRFNEDRAA